jgi:Ca2+-transporting ATPase
MTQVADEHHDSGCMPPTLRSPHAMPVDAVLGALGADAHAGITTSAAVERLALCGRNELAQAPPEPSWKRLARQFVDLLIWILIAAAIVSGLLGEWLDAVAILAIVVLNGILGFVQEGRAEQALAALRKLSTPHAKVIRDGRLQNIEAAELVPGDHIDLEAGDRSPLTCDCLIARASAQKKPPSPANPSPQTKTPTRCWIPTRPWATG